MNPLSLSSMTGLPSGKKHKRGPRAKSGKPGAEHLGALQRAHAAGDLKAAKRAALDYAKAAHQHSAAETPEEHASLVAQDQSAVPAKSTTDRARLAKLAMSRKK